MNFQTDISANGNITVDIEWENNHFKRINSVTPVKQNAIINVEGADTQIALEAGEEYIFA